MKFRMVKSKVNSGVTNYGTLGVKQSRSSEEEKISKGFKALACYLISIVLAVGITSSLYFYVWENEEDNIIKIEFFGVDRNGKRNWDEIEFHPAEHDGHQQFDNIQIDVIGSDESQSEDTDQPEADQFVRTQLYDDELDGNGGVELKRNKSKVNYLPIYRKSNWFECCKVMSPII